MELREALCQIDEIRTRIAATEQFRGYRAIPVALSGAIAMVAALAQPLFVAKPIDHWSNYLVYWIAVAGVAGIVSMSGLVQRQRSSTESLSRELTILALSQFAPCLAAGGLVTLVIVRNAPELAGALPGLVANSVQSGHLRIVPTVAARKSVGSVFSICSVEAFR